MISRSLLDSLPGAAGLQIREIGNAETWLTPRRYAGEANLLAFAEHVREATARPEAIAASVALANEGRVLHPRLRRA